MIARSRKGVIITSGLRFDKRCKETHRTMIADVRGPLTLTVPIEKPYGRTWADTAVSMHGRWYEVAATALESAYGRTPYFEFLADDFLELLRPEFGSVGELNERFDRAIRRAAGITAEVSYTTEPLAVDAIEPWEPEPYWQVRRDKLGFIGGLSMLDLVFNLGPEAISLLLSVPTNEFPG